MSFSENYIIKIMPKTIVCEDSTLRGDITFSSGCVVHPRAIILAEAGPIVFGDNCIIEEYATIAYRSLINEEQDIKSSESKNFRKNFNLPALTIGANNIFEVGCTVEAVRIGDKNTFECKSYVGPNITVSNGCVIGAGVHVTGKRHLAENTVIFGEGCMHREAMDKHASQTLQIDFLRKVLPNYHHLHKSNYDPKKNPVI